MSSPSTTQTKLAKTAITVSLILACWLLFSLFRQGFDWDIFPGKMTPLLNELHEDQRLIKEKTKAIVEPGDEPSMIHPLDWIEWSQKVKLKIAIQKEIEDLNVKIQECENQLQRNPWYPIKRVFDGIIFPILHLLLFFAVVSFSLRVWLRHLIMQGKIGVERI